MIWKESPTFKKLCLGVMCIFFCQSAQPMAFGFAPPSPTQDRKGSSRSQERFFPPFGQLKLDVLSATSPLSNPAVPSPYSILKKPSGKQVSKLIKATQEKLKELDVAPELKNPSRALKEEATSCAVPKSGPLVLEKGRPFSLSTSSKGTQDKTALVAAFNPLPTKERGMTKEQRKENKQDEHWLEKLGNALSSLLVSEVYAQEPAAGPLDSTPDANTTDQFIIDKAAELTAGLSTPQEKAEAIFAFVRNEIGYESYRGSLRGSRGTLWSMAGNALDQASLLIALLRVTGIPAQYAQGTITDPLAQDLILSMFPNPTRVVGCPPPGVERADPANDPQLLTETREHYWVELDMGGGFISADPTFNTTQNLAQLDQSFTTADSTFTEVPDSLRHKVTVRLKAELSDGFTGGLQAPKTVLDHTFNTVGLVGHPLSIGHFVDSVPAGGLVFTTFTHTYTPYIQIGHVGREIDNDELITGETYQEILSNFAGGLGNSQLTGLFLEMDVINADGVVEKHERELMDRIGFVGRQSGGSTPLESSTDGAPSITAAEAVVINVRPGLQSSEALASYLTRRLAPFEQKALELQPLLEELPEEGPLTDEQKSFLSIWNQILGNNAKILGELLAIKFAIESDIGIGALEKGFKSQAHYISPRLTLLHVKRGKETTFIRMDLRKNDIRVVPSPGQVTVISNKYFLNQNFSEGYFLNSTRPDDTKLSFLFEIIRGVLESSLEGEILSRHAEHHGSSAFSVQDVLAHIESFHDGAIIDSKTLPILDTFTISDTAKARITQAINSGRFVLTPSHMVDVNGSQTIGWVEVDAKTGETIFVGEDGGHTAAVEYAVLLTGILVGGLNCICTIHPVQVSVVQIRPWVRLQLHMLLEHLGQRHMRLALLLEGYFFSSPLQLPCVF